MFNFTRRSLFWIVLLLTGLALGCGDGSSRPDTVSKPPQDVSKIVLTGTNWEVKKNGATVGTYDASRTAYSVTYDWAAGQFRLSALIGAILGGDDTLSPNEFALVANRVAATAIQITLPGTTTAQAYPQQVCLPIYIYTANGKPAYARAANPDAPMLIDPSHWQPGPADYNPTGTPALTLSDTTYIGPLSCEADGGVLDGHNPCVIASRDGNDIVVVIISTIHDGDTGGPIRFPDNPGGLDEVRGKTAATTLLCHLDTPPVDATPLYSGPIAQTKMKVICKSLLYIEQAGICKTQLDLTACGVWIIIRGDQVIVNSNCNPQALPCGSN